MIKRCSPECKEHYLDIWEELISPEMLADKLEAFDNIRCSLPSGPRKYVKASEIVNDGRQGRVCADTGSPHLIARERMIQIFKDKGLLFQETTLAMSLADGQQTTGTDFLSSAGLVLDVKNTCWYFWDNPTHKYPFGEELDTPSIVEMSSNTYQLREGEAPVVLIPKPNNQFRLCIDYRKLNEVTVPDTYPLPQIDDLLQEAKHTAYISTIDLKSGYYQVNVNPADRDKTAFVCLFGTYRFKRMPFGHKNAPTTFQRLMDIFRRGLPVLAYLDDIIIMSPTFEQHLADLEAMFKRLMNFKLRANKEKCQFSCSRIPPPKNVKQLQSFLQTCSWYRKFIANFSEIARPLSNLTKKKAFWKWSEEEEKAFQTLKQCLVSPPTLKQADFSKTFLIRTDASNYALGAVLLQREDKEEHPVEFASSLLNPAERNYSTTEREALAVV
ncbi:retrovirus-related Pol polyprotein from transposon 297 [Trichonephila clavipes]|nr:retrovirus-related Pol polyprotein from transposon 297 [Trichonephila clavipes]